MVSAPSTWTPDAAPSQSTISSWSQESKPGKTSPRLLHDLYLFDPAKTIDHSDVLADPAPRFNHGGFASPTVPRDACRHNYAVIKERSRIPKKDYRPASGHSFGADAVCRKCRIHIKVTISYTDRSRRPCPNQDFPVHHFAVKKFVHGKSYELECTSPDCRAEAYVQYQPPAISSEDADLLVNPSRLRTRYDRAVHDEHDRSGFILASPTTSLWKLRRYLGDSLSGAGAGKKIPVRNKRFLESFGGDCDAIFKRLGFTYELVDDEGSWSLPVVTPGAESELETLLLYWDAELQSLMETYSARDGELNPCPSYIWLGARGDFERILSAQDYKRSMQSRRDDNDSSQDHPYYASLGAMRDFSDDLIEFAYDRQVDSDPMNAPYYFDCLHDLANGRASESLQLKASLLESEGVIGQKALSQAYAYFDISEAGGMLSDNFILDRYRSRLDDTGISARPQLRAMLQTIGRARQSPLLIDAASETIDTYPQALSWLGAEESYPDDSILTLFTAKVADNSSSKELARRAVKVIADHRKSDALKSWLATGELKDTGMTVDEACSHLKIQLNQIDDTMLNVVFEAARADNPGSKTEKAIETVREAYSKAPSGPLHAPETWPVGLTSHGNTCYLNSLLQYYFTIKPLRDLILSFDQHRFDLATYKSKVERVGARRVTPLEIRAYQKFVEDLKNLFHQMIIAPGTAVKPEADLVCRAFLKAEETEEATVESSRGQSPPADIAIEGSAPTAMQVDESDGQQVGNDGKSLSTASSTTLAPPTHEDTSMPDSMLESQILLPAPSDSGNQPTETSEASAPALPPRPVSTPVRQQTNLNKAEEAARQQQDVTEVMDEILFRLRCAIKSDGMDSREEQLDQFRDIFYMKISEKTLGADDKITSREEYALNILLNIPSRPTDIYSALDEIFELQTIDHGDKKLRQFRTIQELPPILQINIPRITYDRNTGRGVKVEHRVHLEESLYLDRYYEWQDAEIYERRQDLWAARRHLDVLRAQRDVVNSKTIDLTGPNVMKTAAAYMRNLQACNTELTELGLPPFEFEESIIMHVDELSKSQQVLLESIDGEIAAIQEKIRTAFAEKKQLRYRLHAVFFHRGGYGHGHYWTDIRDFANPQWRVYNDEKVESITNENDIFDAETWQQGTPTYAVYVRDDMKDDLVQAVCRSIPKKQDSEAASGQPEPVDEVMQDAEVEEVPPPLPPNHPPPSLPMERPA